MRFLVAGCPGAGSLPLPAPKCESPRLQGCAGGAMIAPGVGAEDSRYIGSDACATFASTMTSSTAASAVMETSDREREGAQDHRSSSGDGTSLGGEVWNVKDSGCGGELAVGGGHRRARSPSPPTAHYHRLRSQQLVDPSPQSVPRPAAPHRAVPDDTASARRPPRGARSAHRGYQNASRASTAAISAPNPAVDGVLVHDEAPAGAAHRLEHRVAVPRRDRAQVDQVARRRRTGPPPRAQRCTIAPQLTTVMRSPSTQPCATAERQHVVVARIARAAVARHQQRAMLEEDRRIGAAHRGAQQSHRVGRVRRNRHLPADARAPRAPRPSASATDRRRPCRTRPACAPRSAPRTGSPCASAACRSCSAARAPGSAYLRN